MVDSDPTSLVCDCWREEEGVAERQVQGDKKPTMPSLFAEAGRSPQFGSFGHNAVNIVAMCFKLLEE